MGEWVEPDGRVVMHLDCFESARRVAHGLWLRYDVFSDVHPEEGVLLWV